MSKKKILPAALQALVWEPMASQVKNLVSQNGEVIHSCRKRKTEGIKPPSSAAGFSLQIIVNKKYKSIDEQSPEKKSHNAVEDESILLEDTEWFKNMSTEMTAGKAIRADRGLRGWTQKVLAEKLGISIQNLSAMEHDRRPVSKKMAKKLSQVFGVSPESYFKF